MNTEEQLKRMELKLDLILALLEGLCEAIEQEEPSNAERDQTQPL